MKQHGSIFLMAAKGSAHWFFLLLLGMAAVETVMFTNILPMLEQDFYSFEQMILMTDIRKAFAYAIAIFYGITLWRMRDNRGYTTDRLSVPPWAVMFWQTLYSFVCYLIFWGVQLLLVLVFLQIYLGKVDTSFLNHQSIMLSFYRDEFLHTLLPQLHTTRYVCNIAFFLSLSLVPALCLQGMRKNHTQMGIGLLILQCYIGVVFAAQFGKAIYSNTWDRLNIVLVIFLLGAAWYILWERRKSYEREANPPQVKTPEV